MVVKLALKVPVTGAFYAVSETSALFLRIIWNHPSILIAE